MGTTAWRASGLDRLDRLVARHVDAGAAPGAVWLVSRHGEVHTGVAGHPALDDDRPLARDAIFRISSMTKPMVAVVALSCVEDGLIRLDEPVDRLLPELGDRTVLEHEDAPLGWVVPARRPVLVRDLLTFTMGLGIVMAPPGEVPLADALVELELGQGPPGPQGVPEPDEWMRRLGTLPLLHHPGERWMYGTGADVLGVLVARATGQPLAEAVHERLLAPLAMRDTGFSVPETEIDRLVAAYTTDPSTGALHLYDRPDGQWGTAPAFPSGAAGLVSTVDDVHAFARMLLDGGRGPSGPVISRASVSAMTTDQLTPSQKQGALVDGQFRGRGWGFCVQVVTHRTDIAGAVGAYGWDGGMGTAWMNDPAEDLVTVLLTQAGWPSPAPPPICLDFRTGAWAALED